MVSLHLQDPPRIWFLKLIDKSCQTGGDRLLLAGCGRQRFLLSSREHKVVRLCKKAQKSLSAATKDGHGGS